MERPNLTLNHFHLHHRLQGMAAVVKVVGEHNRGPARGGTSAEPKGRTAENPGTDGTDEVAKGDDVQRAIGRGHGAGLMKALGRESLQNAAATAIQRVALPKLIADKTALQRKPLLERLELELDLQRGLRL